MSNSHHLPTSSKPPPPPSSSSTFHGGAAEIPIDTPLRIFITRLTDSLRHAFSRRRPWPEVIDRAAFTRPTSLSDATTRLRKNISYFKVNYFITIASVLAFSLISHPFSLFTLLLLIAAWLLLYLFRPSDQPLIILNRTFSDRETLGVLILSTICVVFLTNVGSVLMSSVLIGVGIVCVHGAFRDPEDLFMDDQDLAGAGLFSLLGGAASSAAVAAGPSMMVRV
ncbi:membrane traffic protein [Lithospermum erythrorhizon]|uniref:PRA1 family protein n=1 Tax=Lithospermum erythrorhizon TaxID=34254 RepID=A0AAV3NQH6_LITER